MAPTTCASRAASLGESLVDVVAGRPGVPPVEPGQHRPPMGVELVGTSDVEERRDRPRSR